MTNDTETPTLTEEQRGRITATYFELIHYLNHTGLPFTVSMKVGGLDWFFTALAHGELDLGLVEPWEGDPPVDITPINIFEETFEVKS